MLRPFLMASAILLATATRGGNEGPFDPGIEGSDLGNKPASLGFEGAMRYLHVRIVLLHYGNVKKKMGTSLEVPIPIASKSYKPISHRHQSPLIPSYPT